MKVRVVETSSPLYSGQPLRVLYVEDNPRDAKLCLKQLEQAGLKLKADVVNTPEEFAEKLLFEEKVAVVPGSAFGAAGTGYVRCSYCTAYNKLEEALVRIERFLKKYTG